MNNVNGMILLPDDWDASYYTFINSNNYSDNTITALQWQTLEQYGAVFLPDAGRRNGTSLSSVGSGGYYWTASHPNGSNSAYSVSFASSGLSTNSMPSRYMGNSVRLVRDVE